MNSLPNMRLLLFCAILVAVMIPAAQAGKVKGLKGATRAASGRNLKEKKGDGKLPKVKKEGPQARTCKTCKLMRVVASSTKWFRPSQFVP